MSIQIYTHTYIHTHKHTHKMNYLQVFTLLGLASKKQNMPFAKRISEFTEKLIPIHAVLW